MTAVLISGCAPPEEQAKDYVTDARLLLEASDLVSAKLELKNALQIAPKHAEARYLMALINEQEEKLEEAIGNLEIAVESDPDYLDARLMLGNFYSLGRLMEQTRKQADAAMALSPDRADVRLLNARAIYLEGDVDQALKETKTALSIDPGFRPAISFAAALHTEAGDIDKAMAVLDDGILEVSGDDIELLRRARVAIIRAHGSPEELRNELEILAREFPDASVYNLALIRLYVADGRQQKAEQVIRDLVARDPDNAEWRIQLAGLLIGLDKKEDAEQSLRRGVDENPDSTTLRLALGGYYEAADRLDEARKIYTEVADKNPRSDESLAARNRIAATYIGTDDERARQLLNEILRDAPDNVDALLYRAAYSFGAQRYDEAIADLQLAVTKQPNSERGLLLLARSRLRNGDAALAEDSYRRLLAINPGNRPATNELAILLGNRGDTDEAEALLRQTLEQAPGDSGASRNLVKALLKQENFSGAEAEAQRIIELGEATGVADYQLGEALLAQREYDRAIGAYQESLRKNPAAIEPLSRLIQVMIDVDKANEAEAYLENHVETYPQQVSAQLLLGDVYRANNKAERSRQVLQDIIAKQPEIIGAYIGLAALHADASDERIEVLADGFGRNPGDPRLGLALGPALKRRGEYEQAIDVYKQVMQRDPSNEFIVNNLSSLLLDHRTDKASHERALQIASRFSTGDPHPLSVGILGWAYYRNGQYSQAVRYLELAVAQAGENPILRYYLGMAYFKNENSSGAKQELQIAVDAANSAGATFTGLDEAEATLKSLRSSG